MTHYFLFGTEACQSLLHDGEEATLEFLREESGWDVFKFIEGDSCPVDLLTSYDGWGDYSTISEEFYNKLLSL